MTRSYAQLNQINNTSLRPIKTNHKGMINLTREFHCDLISVFLGLRPKDDFVEQASIKQISLPHIFCPWHSDVSSIDLRVNRRQIDKYTCLLSSERLQVLNLF